MIELNNKFEKKLDEINKILSKIDKENKTNEKNEIIRLKEENNYDNQNLINLNKKEKEDNSNLNKFENKSLSNFINIDELKLAIEIYDILLNLTIINKQKESLIGINYDLKKIFINFDKDEIKSYIHHLIDNKIKSEDLINKVLEKLSLLLPQDIIILKKYSGFDIKYPKIGEKIIEGYNKGEHNNFESFLKTMQNKKNVIYTFSKFNKYNCGMNKIENDILGKIDLENITTIEINSFTLGNNFENELNERFFNNKNKKICLLNFTSNEKDLLNKVRLIIENKEKEIKSKQNENIDKTIIFIVYLNREFYNNNIEENKNKIFNETIPLTSEYYQIFIDDLNGSDAFTINDILNLNINDLIKKLFSPNFLFDEQIFKTLSYLNFIIDFEYKAINQKNYSKNIGNFLLDNFDIKKKKNQLIIKQMGKDENIICNSFKKKDLVTLNDTNLIFCIAKYLNEIYNHLFNIFYYKAEKDQFFSSLLTLEDSNENNMNIINMVDENDDFQDMKELDFSKNNELKKDMINKVIEIYLEHFSFGNEKGNQNIENINGQLGANKINIILGLQLPGMFPIITSIIKKSRDDIIKKYLINESNLRKNIENENIEKEKENYEKKFNDLNNILLNELIKNDKIKSLIAENELVKKEFVDSFLEDYYIIFIYNNLNIYINELNNKGKGCVFNLSELKKILKFLVKQNDENLKADEALETIANIINWTEAYSIEITYILKVYIMLRNYINNIKKENKEKNIYDMMEDFIKDKKVNYRRDEKCKEYTTRVNRALFNGFESILKIITSCKELYIERKGKIEIFELLNMLKEILNQMNKFNLNLKLYSKEILTLQEIIEIINGLIIEDKFTIDKIVEIIKYFSEFNKNNLVENFEKFFNYLEKIFEKNKSFYKIISIVFKNEFVKNNNDDKFKKKIIETIISKNEYILNCNKLLKIILDFDIRPSKIRGYWEKILEDKNIFQIINNNCNNEYLEQIVFNIYDFLFMQYFTKTKNLLNEYIKSKTNEEDVYLYNKLVNAIKNKDENDDTGIIFDLSFEMLGDCLRFFDKIENYKGKNTELVKLYSISYIKAYLNQLVKFSLDEKTLQKMGRIKDIIKLITGENNSFRKVIKIYIIKLFYNSKKVQKSYKEIYNIDFNILEYNFVCEMLDDKNNPELDIIKEIIEEKNSPTDEKYKDYPYLKYFIYSNDKQSEKDYFIKQFEENEKNIYAYPVIYKFLEENKNSKLIYLNELEKYNSFCNFMVDYYSFKITRVEANNKKLKEEDIYNKQITNSSKNIFKEFFDIWNKICKYATKYKENDLKDIKEIKEDDTLAYFLNDDKELGKGMYIAAGYEYFIKLQNDFLNYILDHGEDKPYLKCYFDNIKNKIPIYEANNNQILSINSMFKSSEYKSFFEIVNTYTRRKIYNNDGSINYLNYNKLEFDLQGIEEEFAKIILPGKCLFEDENNLNFIKYWKEGFNFEKNDFLQKFEKIIVEPEELTKAEKIKLNDYIKHNYCYLNDYVQIYNYSQLLFSYLNENNFKKDEIITALIDNLPKNIKTENEILKNIFKGFKVNKIYSIFLFIEQLCFELFSKNLIKEYKLDIDEIYKNKIIDLVKNKKDDIKGLADAVRRFISRVLYFIKNPNDLSPKTNLNRELKKNFSFWDIQFRDEQKINTILEPFEEFYLTVGQSFNFYQIIKEKEDNINNNLK